MEKQKPKVYARYYIVRGHGALWKGDPAEGGSKYRGFAITSNEFFSTAGTFQVYGLEDTSAGIKDGELVMSDEKTTVLFDNDFEGLDVAGQKFDELNKRIRESGV